MTKVRFQLDLDQILHAELTVAAKQAGISRTNGARAAIRSWVDFGDPLACTAEQRERTRRALDIGEAKARAEAATVAIANEIAASKPAIKIEPPKPYAKKPYLIPVKQDDGSVKMLVNPEYNEARDGIE